MKDIQQLIKKNNQEGRYKEIFPKTYTDAIVDRGTGMALTDILAGFNMYFLSYVGSMGDTRLQVPSYLRRTGLWITYVKYDDTVQIEWYDYCDTSDEAWKDSKNWRKGDNSLVGDLTISSEGNWVINGVDTGVKAQGPAGKDGLPITPRVSEDKTKIEYSYNLRDWYEMFPLSLITPTIEVAEANVLTPGSTPTVTNTGDNFNVELTFGLPKSPTVTVGEVETYAAGHAVTVVNSGTQYQAVLNFGIPMGNTGAKGEKGDGWEVKGWVDNVKALPSTGTLGDLYIVGTTQPYSSYVWKDSVSTWVNIGSVTEIKASVFDGGRADSKYGGTRTIDCGGADAFVTNSVEGD